jgi:hypothetical protein
VIYSISKTYPSDTISLCFRSQDSIKADLIDERFAFSTFANIKLIFNSNLFEKYSVASRSTCNIIRTSSQELFYQCLLSKVTASNFSAAYNLAANRQQNTIADSVAAEYNAMLKKRVCGKLRSGLSYTAYTSGSTIFFRDYEFNKFFIMPSNDTMHQVLIDSIALLDIYKCVYGVCNDSIISDRKDFYLSFPHLRPYAECGGPSRLNNTSIIVVKYPKSHFNADGSLEVKQHSLLGFYNYKLHRFTSFLADSNSNLTRYYQHSTFLVMDSMLFRHVSSSGSRKDSTMFLAPVLLGRKSYTVDTTSGFRYLEPYDSTIIANRIVGSIVQANNYCTESYITSVYCLNNNNVVQIPFPKWQNSDRATLGKALVGGTSDKISVTMNVRMRDVGDGTIKLLYLYKGNYYMLHFTTAGAFISMRRFFFDVDKYTAVHLNGNLLTAKKLYSEDFEFMLFE